MVSDELREKLTKLREEPAKILKRYAPEWCGEAFPTWTEYPNVPDETAALNARGAVCMIDAALRPDTSTEYAGEVYGLLRASKSHEVLKPLTDSYYRSQESRQAGGKASEILATPEQKKLALDLIAEYHTAHVSKTAACTRAVAQLKSQHDIEVSKETLLRLLRDEKVVQR